MGKADTTALEAPRGAWTGDGDRGVVIGFGARGRSALHLISTYWAASSIGLRAGKRSEDDP